MTNLLLRVLTGVIGIPMVALVTYWGGWPFVVLVLIVVWAAQYEFYKMAPQPMLHRHIAFGLFAGGLIVLQQFRFDYLVDLAVLAFVLMLMYDLFGRKEGQGWMQTAWMTVGVVYPLLFSYIIPIREGLGEAFNSDLSFALTLGLLAIVWMTDTLAYFVGKSIGKRPLAPSISPKKTWEGTLGGLAGALLTAAILKLTVLGILSWVDAVALALIGGIGGQLGDLVESRLKRSVGVKDSGTILPGHGGVLDRIDALIIAIPLYYFYLFYVAGF